jgi:Zn-dependent metalloprotease
MKNQTGVPCTCFIIPSKVLRRLADAAEGDERERLMRTALLSERMRGHRTARGLMLMNNAAGEMRRTVYDCRHTELQPPRGKLVRGEGSAKSKDRAVNEAYDGSGDTYRFYQQVLGRNSIDNRGMRLDSFVHYGRGFNNAFWDGGEMVYGDGDGVLFSSFTRSLDVIAHELTHGVTQFATPGGLDYVDQSGALNESFSDVFGSVVKQWKLGQSVNQADWLIGAGILAKPGWHALRSLKEPGNAAVTYPGDDQPSTMKGYVDGGDVHTNSGIPNHAFYLAAKALGGNSWGDAAKIWYRALPHLQPDATFVDAARATISVAREMGKKQQDAVTFAWRAVRVLP